MSRIYILDYDMDARPLRFVYRDDFRHQSCIRTTWKSSSPSWKSAFPSLSAEATSFGIPPGSRASPTRRTAPSLYWTTFQLNEAEQEANGFVPGEKFYQRKGEREKYESPMQDPPLDYGAYGVSVGKSGQLHQAYNGFACYLDLELTTAPWKGLSPP